MSPLIYLAIIVGCLFLSAFFSASETALLRLRPDEVEDDVEKAEGPSAVAARSLVRSTPNLLLTLLIGNNVANILAASCGASLAVYYFGEELGILASTVFLTLFILIFSEFLPKTIAARHPKVISYAVALPLYLLHHLMWPIHALFDRIIEPFLKSVIGTEAADLESSEQVMRLARKFRHKRGSSPEAIIAATAGAADMTVSEIMVPRTEIVAFPDDMAAETLLDKMIEEQQTRVPIYRQSLDKILGVVHIKDLIKQVRSGRRRVRDVLKPVLRVPERKPILPLLGDMQRNFSHIAIVEDEFGVTRGLVTQEDILEELVGEIRDEFDQEELEEIKRISPHCFEVLGRISVRDFNRETGMHVEAERGDTLSGLTFNLLGRSPRLNDVVTSGDYKVQVLGVSGNRITRVRVEAAEPVVEEPKGIENADSTAVW